MRILGIDPGIRNTGWAIVENSRPKQHGLIEIVNSGKLTAAQVLTSVLPILLSVAYVEYAAVEEVVWQGSRRKITMPLSHVAGGIAGALSARGVHVYLLTPSMKGRGPLKLKGKWSDHEQDAVRLALRLYSVLNARGDSGRPKRSVEQERSIFAARLVRGQVYEGD